MSNILVTGATGYIGTRLCKALSESGHRPRCLVRNPSRVDDSLKKQCDISTGDISDPSALKSALHSIDCAYYLIHSMNSPEPFVEKDRLLATQFASAAAESGIRKIIYLGGLFHGDKPSSHMASRREVGEILRGSGVHTIEFRASIIIGKGSLSFEMMKSLVERLPIMVTPRWVSRLAQPIAIDDVISYLIKALDYKTEQSVIFEIGGPDRLSYLALMKEYAKLRSLKRLIIPVPVLTPWLSSLWLGLVTPFHTRIGRRLIESIKNDSIVTDYSVLQAFPSIRTKSIHQSLRQVTYL